MFLWFCYLINYKSNQIIWCPKYRRKVLVEVAIRLKEPKVDIIEVEIDKEYIPAIEPIVILFQQLVTHHLKSSNNI